jgi:hypothetical protein
VDIKVGPGARFLFWEDPWVNGSSVDAVAPAVLKLVLPGGVKRHLVTDRVPLNAWALDITGERSVDALV